MAMLKCPELPNWTADTSIGASNSPGSEYAPLKEVECCEGHSMHENHGADNK